MRGFGRRGEAWSIMRLRGGWKNFMRAQCGGRRGWDRKMISRSLVQEIRVEGNDLCVTRRSIGEEQIAMVRLCVDIFLLTSMMGSRNFENIILIYIEPQRRRILHEAHQWVSLDAKMYAHQQRHAMQEAICDIHSCCNCVSKSQSFTKQQG